MRKTEEQGALMATFCSVHTRSVQRLVLRKENASRCPLQKETPLDIICKGYTSRCPSQRTHIKMPCAKGTPQDVLHKECTSRCPQERVHLRVSSTKGTPQDVLCKRVHLRMSSTKGTPRLLCKEYTSLIMSFAKDTPQDVLHKGQTSSCPSQNAHLKTS